MRVDADELLRPLVAKGSLTCNAPLRHAGQYAHHGGGRCQRAVRPGYDRCSYHIDEDKAIVPAPEVPGRCNARKHRARWRDPFVEERCSQYPVVGRARCRMHSGQSVEGPSHKSWRHGRRSKFWRASQAAIKAALADDAMSLADVIAKLRRKINLLEASADPKSEPLALALRGQLMKAIEVERRRLSERNGKDGATVLHFAVLFNAAVEAIRKHVSDDGERSAVLSEMQGIIASDEAFAIYVRRRADELGLPLDGGPEDEDGDPEEPLLSLDAFDDADAHIEDEEP